MLEPSFKETLTPIQAQARIMQLRATLVPSKSVPGKAVYWIGPKKTWILATPRGQSIVLGYYQMEKCPCED